MKRKNIEWTKAEDQILYKNYPNKPKEEILKLLPNRTGDAIISRATKYLDIHRAIYWTNEEIEILIEYWRKLPPGKREKKLIELLPKRSWRNIQSKAARLGIAKKKPFWTEKEDEILIEIWNEKPKKEILKLLPNRSWRSINHRARFLIKKRNLLPRTYHKKIRENNILEKIPTFDKLFINKNKEEFKRGFLIGYLAGILDGEGNINLGYDKRWGGSFHSKIYISNTDKKIIDFVHQNILPFANITMRSNNYCGHKKLYRISIDSHYMINAILSKLYPYLIAKRKQAILINDFLSLHNAERSLNNPPYSTSSKEWELYEKMKLLNKRGAQVSKRKNKS